MVQVVALQQQACKTTACYTRKDGERVSLQGSRMSYKSDRRNVYNHDAMKISYTMPEQKKLKLLSQRRNAMNISYAVVLNQMYGQAHLPRHKGRLPHDPLNPIGVPSLPLVPQPSSSLYQSTVSQASWSRQSVLEYYPTQSDQQVQQGPDRSSWRMFVRRRIGQWPLHLQRWFVLSRPLLLVGVRLL